MDAAKSESVPWFFSHIAVNVSSRSHINFYSQMFLPSATVSVVLKKPKTKPITPVETTFLNLLLVISSCHYRILSFSFIILSYLIIQAVLVNI